ncbi:MAG: DUF5004 domain-containing protein, partial [Bdellovibrionota bacterium]
MKTLLIALSLLTINAHAAIPKRVELTSENWCTKRPSEERMDKIIFKNDGKVTIQTFHSTGDLEKVSNGTWQLKNDKLSVNTDKRPSSLSVAISEDGQSLNFSTGMKAT